jgi:hypothetical protein
MSMDASRRRLTKQEDRQARRLIRQAQREQAEQRPRRGEEMGYYAIAAIALDAVIADDLLNEDVHQFNLDDVIRPYVEEWGEIIGADDPDIRVSYAFVHRKEYNQFYFTISCRVWELLLRWDLAEKYRLPEQERPPGAHYLSQHDHDRLRLLPGARERFLASPMREWMDEVGITVRCRSAQGGANSS